MDKFIKKLKSKEKRSIIEIMALMSYSPSIGRVLRKGGVKKFQKMAVRIAGNLNKIKKIEDFDRLHKRWVGKIREKIKTNKNRKCSYGQAQKAINVFLKLLVDWARLPDRRISKGLLPFLHVPLDKILMKEIGKNFPYFYKREIKLLRKENNSDQSLAKIDMAEYLKWQEFFRKKHPKKPLLFDIAWAINRG